MKKLFLLFFISVFVTQLITAQNIGIGTTTPFAKLHVKQETGTTGIRARTFYTGSASSYGILGENFSTNTNNRYGIYGQSIGDANATILYGVYGLGNPNEEDAETYGGYFLAENTGNGVHYGVYGKANGENCFGVYGENASFNGHAGYFDGRVYVHNRLGVGMDPIESKVAISGTGEAALYIENKGAGSDTLFGINLLVDSLATATQFGLRAVVKPNSASTQNAYGLYTKVNIIGTGEHFGVHAIANGDNNVGVYGKSNAAGIGIKGVNTNDAGYAGYFEGNGYVNDRLEIRDKIFLRPVGNGGGGEIELFDNEGDQTITIRAGQSETNGSEILMYNDAAEKTIELDADYTNGRGRVITDELEIKAGSDLAEHFDINGDITSIEPGMVVAIDQMNEGQLVINEKAYNPLAVGVISGANGIKPGMLMGQKGTIADGDYPIAMSGRVYVKVDARKHAVQCGDLLTSADLSGHAQKLNKRKKGSAVILGKALTSLKEGTGFVLMLVE